MLKIDMHIHTCPDGVIVKGRSQARDMLKHMTSLGIGKGVLMSSGETAAYTVGFTVNAEVQAIAEKYPENFAWMCTLDDDGNCDTVYDRLAACKEKGAIGIGELIINRRLDDPFLVAIFDAAEKLDMPVTIHMSPGIGVRYGVVDEPGLPLLESILKNHPKLKILGHSKTFWIEISGNAPTSDAGRLQAGEGPVSEGGRLVELFTTCPNLYGDLSASSGGKAIMRDENFGVYFLETFADRLFFATDMVKTSTVEPLAAWMQAQVEKGTLSKEAYDKICYKNAQEVFGL